MDSHFSLRSGRKRGRAEMFSKVISTLSLFCVLFLHTNVSCSQEMNPSPLNNPSQCSRKRPFKEDNLTIDWEEMKTEFHHKFGRSKDFPKIKQIFKSTQFFEEQKLTLNFKNNSSYKTQTSVSFILAQLSSSTAPPFSLFSIEKCFLKQKLLQSIDRFLTSQSKIYSVEFYKCHFIRIPNFNTIFTSNLKLSNCTFYVTSENGGKLYLPNQLKFLHLEHLQIEDRSSSSDSDSSSSEENSNSTKLILKNTKDISELTLIGQTNCSIISPIENIFKLKNLDFVELIEFSQTNALLATASQFKPNWSELKIVFGHLEEIKNCQLENLKYFGELKEINLASIGSLFDVHFYLDLVELMKKNVKYLKYLYFSGIETEFMGKMDLQGKRKLEIRHVKGNPDYINEILKKDSTYYQYICKLNLICNIIGRIVDSTEADSNSEEESKDFGIEKDYEIKSDCGIEDSIDRLNHFLVKMNQFQSTNKKFQLPRLTEIVLSLPSQHPLFPSLYQLFFQLNFSFLIPNFQQLTIRMFSGLDRLYLINNYHYQIIKSKIDRIQTLCFLLINLPMEEIHFEIIFKIGEIFDQIGTIEFYKTTLTTHFLFHIFKWLEGGRGGSMKIEMIKFSFTNTLKSKQEWYKFKGWYLINDDGCREGSSEIYLEFGKLQFAQVLNE